MLKVLDCYSWLYDIVKACAKGVRVPLDEINIIGGRNSGKSVSIQILFALLSQLDVPIGLVGVRANKDGANELFNEMSETFELCNVKASLNKSKYYLRTKFNDVRIIGLNSMSNYKAKKSGLARFGEVKYIFIYYEERFEFTMEDYLAVREAIRGIGKNIQTICINVCNPWAKSNSYVQYCESYQKWNRATLEKTGNQIGIFDERDKETGLVSRKLFQYTNWRCAREVLQESVIKNILGTWKIDRQRALTTDLGLPGYEWGAIYTHLLDKIGIPVVQSEPQWILAGMDYGWSAQESGGKTACVFGVASEQMGVDIYSEFIHDPAKHPMDPTIVCERIVDYYVECMTDYCNKIRSGVPRITKVRVDNAAVGIISILNSVVRRKRHHNWLSFIPCSKFAIPDRIDIQQALMGKGLFRMSNECAQLYREFESAHYKTEIEKRDRVKENDHTLNAYEYALECCMYQLGRKIIPQHDFVKKFKETTIW